MIESHTSPTLTTNAAEIAAINEKLLNAAAELRRIEGDLDIKDRNVWATINIMQEKYTQSRSTNWQLIIGAMSLMITIIVLWGRMSVSPIEQKLADYETRIGQTWQSQSKLSDKIESLRADLARIDERTKQKATP